MPNSHANTKQVRLPIRAAARLHLLARKRGLTVATTTDAMVTQLLTEEAPEILEQTAHLPAPRKAMPTSKPSIYVDWLDKL